MSLIYETPGSNIHELLIVGIGYRVDAERIKGLAQWAAWRTHDLTPVERNEIEEYWNKRLSSLVNDNPPEVQTGGAASFLEAIREEVIPFVESRYRAASDNRGLAGFSYGGLFTLYTLFHDTGLFMRYFAGSPTMWDELFEYEEFYASSHDDLDARVFMTAGSNEKKLCAAMKRMADRLSSREYPGLELETWLFEGEGHASVYAASVSRALCVLYNKDWLSV
jgi:predicted alpha/beta superfamily hydrolase